ncbi:MAG TPA: NAD(+)/NADH kinase [Gaiellaceae bacterium]|nr:NAD(+)/NADH kinase [Gaiellaceae bacterium]
MRRAAVVTHGKARTIGPAIARLETVAREAGVELLFGEIEAEKHGLEATPYALEEPDVALVLGGDGTILRTLGRFLGTGVPVIGVNFGRVGFLTSIQRDELESGVARVFAGDYATVELPTLELQLNGGTWAAVNDVVFTSAAVGRMIELGWAIRDEDLGIQPCDGLICATPSGSTAYNLSNGGPVLVWGLDAMVLTFVAPHSLSARPLVVPPGADLIVWNRTVDVPVGVLSDGHAVGELQPAGRGVVRLGESRSLLGSLPETTFFTRYRETFGQ